MNPETTVVIFIILFAVLMYACIKRPWKKGYLYVKDNGKIMRGRSYSTRRSFEKRSGGEARIEDSSTSGTAFPAQNEEKSTPSKFDFLFGKKEDEK